MATIHLSNIYLETIIGTKEKERLQPQELILNIWFDYNACMASDTDDLQYAVDYEKLTNNIINSVEKSQYFLVEKLSHIIMDVIFKEPLITRATVIIDKPEAIPQAESISISLTREREA